MCRAVLHLRKSQVPDLLWSCTGEVGERNVTDIAHVLSTCLGRVETAKRQPTKAIEERRRLPVFWLGIRLVMDVFADRDLLVFRQTMESRAEALVRLGVQPDQSAADSLQVTFLVGVG